MAARIGSLTVSIAELEVLPHLGVRNPLEALSAKSGVGEKRCQFKERQAVRRKHIQRIAQQFVRPGAEPVQPPVHLEKFRDLRDGDEIGSPLPKRVEARRTFPGRRARSTMSRSLKCCLQLPLLRGDGAQEKRRRIAVQVEIQESRVRLRCPADRDI